MRTRTGVSLLVRSLVVSSLLVGAAPAHAAVPPTPDLAGAEAAFAAALKAREAGDLKGYRAGIERAAELLPDASRLLYRLAGARLLDGDEAGALEALNRQVAAGMLRDPREDPDFARLAGSPAFVELLSRMNGLATPIVASTVAFEVPERDLLVEGIAYDPSSKSYFVSSVRQGKILRRIGDGKWERLGAFDGGALGSPLGMGVDAERRRLWIASAGLPYGGATAEALNRGAVLAIDLASGKVAMRSGPFPAGQSTNDLAVARDGAVYVSDPEAKAIVKIGADAARTVVVEGGGLRSPGGLALSADEKLLYVADWTNGLAVVDLTARTLSWMRPPAGATVLGIDGLIRNDGSLVAIQNGVNPPRIQRLRLAADGRSLTSAETLERAVKEWDEPTLGVVIDGDLYYVGTSQWPRYGQDGKPVDDPAAWPLPQVRRLPLR